MMKYINQKKICGIFCFYRIPEKRVNGFDSETVYWEFSDSKCRSKLIYRNTIMDWFQERIKKDGFLGVSGKSLGKMWQLWKKNCQGI